jgi:hypothetical protein
MRKSINDIKGESVPVRCRDTLETADTHGAFIDVVLVVFELGTGVDRSA